MNEMDGKHALIVDDDQVTCNALRQALEMLGMQTEIVMDGLEALDMINRQPPDLVLLDVMMPHLDGLSVLARLRKNAHTRRIPVIVVSSCPVGERELARLPGVNRVLHKSEFSMDAMRSILADVMGAAERSVA
jgi:CheY-like chemotaxis protein